jgi:hypothetical protein
VALSDEDTRWLGRCVELAGQALDAGDEPFGSEFAIARWSVTNLSPAERAAAHAWVGLGRIVFALPPVAPLPVTAVAPHLVADRPAPQYRDARMALYAARFRP